MRLHENSDLVVCLDGKDKPHKLPYGKAEVPSSRFLGMDTRTNRFCQIDCFGKDITLSDRQSLRQRADLIGQLWHPAVPTVFEHFESADGSVTIAMELESGESLRSFLRNVKPLPASTVTGLISQIAVPLVYMTRAPRILATLRLSDFQICIDNGRFLTVRLGGLGFHHAEAPRSDFLLLSDWITNVRNLHEQLLVDRGAEYDSAVFASAYDELMDRAKQSEAPLSLLSDLEETVLIAGGYSLDDVGPLRRGLTEVNDQKLVPRGILAKFLMANGRLERRIREKYLPEMVPLEVDLSTFQIRACKRDNPEDKVDLVILPPERLMAESIAEPLKRRMFDQYLKSHPSGFRIREVEFAEEFSLVSTETAAGFTLNCLQATREGVSQGEALAIIRQIDKALTNFESADFLVRDLNPSQVFIYFETIPDDLKVYDLLNWVPMNEWPAWGVKLRVERLTDLFIEPVSSPWRAILASMGGKSFPALALWLTE
ncbi:MAG: hypothetical protein AAF226_09700, partial [Verrucomicrobiota bacterium]